MEAEKPTWDILYKQLIEGNSAFDKAREDVFRAIDMIKAGEKNPFRKAVFAMLKMTLCMISLAMNDERITAFCQYIGEEMSQEECLHQSKGASC